MARDLRRTASQLARVVDPIVSDAAAYGVELGAAVGGRFAGSRRPLTVKVRDVSNRNASSSATIAGETAGAWSIKSYGRTGGYTVRPRRQRRRRALDLRAAGTRATAAAAVTVRRATTGDDRWRRRVAEPVADRFAELGAEHVARVVNGGR